MNCNISIFYFMFYVLMNGHLVTGNLSVGLRPGFRSISYTQVWNKSCAYTVYIIELKRALIAGNTPVILR